MKCISATCGSDAVRAKEEGPPVIVMCLACGREWAIKPSREPIPCAYCKAPTWQRFCCPECERDYAACKEAYPYAEDPVTAYWRDVKDVDRR